MDTRNLTSAQLKKLAALKARGACYVVLIGNTYTCLTHDRPADNPKRCDKAKKGKHNG